MTFNDLYNNKNTLQFIQAFAYNKYSNSKIKHDMDYEDFLQICYINIDKYVSSYDINKSKLKTYLGRIINSTFLMENRKINQNCRCIDTKIGSLYIDSNSIDNNTYENIIPSDFSLDNEIEKNETSIAINNCHKSLKKERDKKILELLYNEYTIAEIQRELKIKSRTTIYQSIERIKNNIINYL